LNRQCPATTLKGGQCSGSVPEGGYHCWYHNPANSDKRRRAASRGGKGNRSKVSKDLHTLLQDLTTQVIEGTLEPYPASVAGQLVGVRLRLLEYERRLKETEELVVRIERLEQAAKEGQRGARWAQ
jgi:hypothetical protein